MRSSPRSSSAGHSRQSLTTTSVGYRTPISGDMEIHARARDGSADVNLSNGAAADDDSAVRVPRG